MKSFTQGIVAGIGAAVFTLLTCAAVHAAGNPQGQPFQHAALFEAVAQLQQQVSDLQSELAVTKAELQDAITAESAARQAADAALVAMIEAETAARAEADADIIEYVDAVVATAGHTSFGSWERRDENTIYEAETDGIVVAYAHDADVHIECETWGTETNVWTADSGVRTKLQYSSVTMPVRKGDWWRVKSYKPTEVYWIPLVP